MSLMRKAIIRIVFAALAGCVASGAAAHSDESALFECVPPAHRESLQLRLADLVRAERAKDWDSLYGLLDREDYLRGQSKDDFIRSRTELDEAGRSVVTDFDVESCRPDSAGFENRYEVWGCAETQWKGKHHHWRSCVTAYLKDGQWYFSEILTTFTAVDGPPASCDRDRHRSRSTTTPN